MQGALLLRMHPEVATRDCEDCQKYFYNETTGKREPGDSKGNPSPRNGAPTPCRFINPQTGETRCPKGTPEDSKALNERNWQALEHYRECVAVGEFPDDPIVRRNAGLIRGLEDQIDRARQERIEMMLQAALSIR